MCIRLNKNITIYMCPSITTYKNRRENKEIMYNFMSLEIQLVNSRVAIYFRAYSHASFHCSAVNSLFVRSALVLDEQTCFDSSDSQ